MAVMFVVSLGVLPACSSESEVTSVDTIPAATA